MTHLIFSSIHFTLPEFLHHLVGGLSIYHTARIGAFVLYVNMILSFIICGYNRLTRLICPNTGDILRPKHILLQLFVSEGDSLSTRTILEGNSKDSFLFRNSKMKASMKLCCHYAIGFSDN